MLIKKKAHLPSIKRLVEIYRNGQDTQAADLAEAEKWGKKLTDAIQRLIAESKNQAPSEAVNTLSSFKIEYPKEISEPLGDAYAKNNEFSNALFYYNESIKLGVQVDIEEKFSEYTNSVDSNIKAKAMEYVGKYYMEKDAPDLEKAYEWYEKRYDIEKSYSRSIDSIVYAYDEYAQDDNQIKKQMEWLLKFANKGHIASIRKLIEIYTDGKGSQPVDANKAQEWTKKL